MKRVSFMSAASAYYVRPLEPMMKDARRRRIMRGRKNKAAASCVVMMKRGGKVTTTPCIPHRRRSVA